MSADTIEPDRAAQEAEALEQGAGVRRLDDLVVLEIRGEDAHEWLSGQVTNDLRALEPGDAVYALFTNVKGKILADAWVLRREAEEDEDRFWVLVPRVSREALLESFDTYIVMEDVEPSVKEDLAVCTVQGPKATEVVEAATRGATPWPCDRLGMGGVDLVVPAAEADAQVAALREAGATAVSDAGWELVRLRRGIPRFGRDFDARRYPQEAGLKARAVSFQKGCYLGQEVVCMLENRGKLSRRLVELSLPAGAEVAPETPLEADGKAVGEVTSAIADPGSDGALRAMAYLKAAWAEPGKRLSAGGAEATVRRVVD